jgi:hypothetical protein
MAQQRQRSEVSETDRGNSTRENRDAAISAIHHVGPTLESKPGEDLDGLGDAAEPSSGSEADPLGTERAREAENLIGSGKFPKPEPLITRLPGDTSSDPHTDVGPDNATTVQERGEKTRK